MASDPFDQAKALVKQGKYTEAKTLLRKINTPKAKEWIEKLEAREPSSQRSSISSVIWLIGIVVVGLLSGGLGFLAGRESVRYEIASALGAAFNPTKWAENEATYDTSGTTSAATYSASRTEVMIETTATQSVYLTPAPSTEFIPEQYGLISVRPIRINRPATIPVKNMFGDVTQPTEGAQYVAAQFEVLCATTEITCYTSGTEPLLLLEDGRTVYPLMPDAFYTINTNDDKIVGGKSRLVWRMYEVPEDAVIQYIQINMQLVSLP